MKKPYIANYIEEKTLRLSKDVIHETMNYTKLKRDIEQESTIVTKSIEADDNDEFCIFKSTIKTACIENDDDDCFCSVDSTMITETIEADDNDEFCVLKSTIKTDSIENDDDDSFCSVPSET